MILDVLSRSHDFPCVKEYFPQTVFSSDLLLRSLKGNYYGTNFTHRWGRSSPSRYPAGQSATADFFPARRLPEVSDPPSRMVRQRKGGYLGILSDAQSYPLDRRPEYEARTCTRNRRNQPPLLPHDQLPTRMEGISGVPEFAKGTGEKLIFLVRVRRLCRG